MPEDFNEYWRSLLEIAATRGVATSGDPFDDRDFCDAIAKLKEEQLIKGYYKILLNRSGGIQASAARMAGINPKTLTSRLNKYQQNIL